jgi:hypothetical protein
MASGVEELVGCTSVGDNPLGGLGYSLRRDGALEWLSAGRGAGPADLVADPANHELPSVIRVGFSRFAQSDQEMTSFGGGKGGGVLRAGSNADFSAGDGFEAS